jgi:DNA polymerase-3 subunit epsilon
MDFLVLDLETTGTNPNIHGIVQIAAKYYENDVPVKTLNVKVTPSSEVVTSLGALRVNKTLYSNLSSLTDYRITESDAVLQFADFLLSIGKDKIFVMGHNVNFDMNFITALFNKYKIELESTFAYRLKDTATIGMFLMDAGLINVPKFSLENLALALGIQVDKTKTHDGMYDVELTVQIYRKQIELLRSLV